MLDSTLNTYNRILLENPDAFSMANPLHITTFNLVDNDLHEDGDVVTIQVLDKLIDMLPTKPCKLLGVPGAAFVLRAYYNDAEHHRTKMNTKYVSMSIDVVYQRYDGGDTLKDANIVLEFDTTNTICSICGEDISKSDCSHTPNNRYNGILCWYGVVGDVEDIRLSLYSDTHTKYNTLYKCVSDGYDPLYIVHNSRNAARYKYAQVYDCDYASVSCRVHKRLDIGTAIPTVYANADNI